MKQTLFTVLAGLLLRGAVAQVPEPAFPTGTVIPEVKCSADPKQSYALYLPSAFSTARQWPIIYVFDPAAKGEAAVEVIRAAAEKFGYIVAASNNSRNGPGGGSAEAATAVWQDTQLRLPIDPGRHYLAGMSGGARVATSIALACGNCAAGVIANAAGFPSGSAMPHEIKFAYFAAVGDADFNYEEFAKLRPKLERSGARFQIRIFAGKHDWAPPEIWLEALNWMDLQAMASGVLPRDPSRIQKSLDEAVERAKAFAANHDPLAAMREYESAVNNFSSLADVTAAKSSLTVLERGKVLKAAEKQETAEIEEQDRIQEGPSMKMNQISAGDLDLDPTALAEFRSEFSDLKRQAADSRRRSLPTRRALSGLLIQAYESGERSIEQKNYDVALRIFDLAVAGSENPGWAHYQRARIYAITADKKHMLVELRLCVAGAVHDASALDSPEFQAYRNQPEFQAISDEWKQKIQR